MVYQQRWRNIAIARQRATTGVHDVVASCRPLPCGVELSNVSYLLGKVFGGRHAMDRSSDPPLYLHSYLRIHICPPVQGNRPSRILN